MKQNTQEWLEMRKTHIGASDAPIIMGVSKFKRSDGRKKTPYTLWQEKLDLLPEDAPNASMKFGKENESVAREEYEKMTGEKVEPSILFHKKYPYMMASLDGLNSTKDLIVEIKNAGKEDHEIALQGRVPHHYYPQVQHQLACSDLDYMHYFSFNQGKGKIVEIHRDNNYLDEMYEKEADFWEKLSKFEPPETTADDFIERGVEWLQTAQLLWKIKQQKKEIMMQEKKLEEELRKRSEGQNSISGEFYYLCSPCRGTIDYSAIPELKGVDLEKYRKDPINRWRLSQKN